MAASLPSFGGIASRLVHDGLISEEAMQKVLAETQQQKTNLIAHLVDNKLVRPDAIAWVVSREFGDPLIDLEAINVNYIELTHYLKTKKRDSPTRVLDSNETNHQRLASILERLQR